MADHAPYRYKHGWIKIGGGYPEIHKADLSTPDARRSREVSPGEFQSLAATGAAEYEKIKRGSSPSIFEKPSSKQNEIMNQAFNESRAEWGGSTIDSHTGEFLPQGADKYALTVRDPGMDSISIAPTASAAEFRKAFGQATARYRTILQRPGHSLGVFHDADKKTIDFDPVYVTGKKSETETIGAYTRTVGGAYHFKSGDGFWPPHVKG